MGQLQSVVQTCVPRAEVLSGGLADNHFAAQLDHVVRTPERYPAYGEAEQFFALTYPTSGLKRLLARTFGRLSGVRTEGAEHGVIRAETSFGGGKTHSLMAVYHLARGARPSNLTEFLDPAMLPGECQVAAVVADTLDPENGLLTNGVRTFTIWGELAAQFGPDAYAKLQASDDAKTAPGKATWAEIIGDRPTIIIIDEIAEHLRQLSSSGNVDTRRLARAIPVFMKNLFELAASNPRVVVIVTLANAADAYGRETSELVELLDELDGFQEVLSDAQSVLARMGQVIRPAGDDEIAEILKRRLFERIDPSAALHAGTTYQTYYEHLLAHGEQLGGGAEAPVTYGERISATYPFHPELIRVLDQRIGTIALFHRARGALKLLAEVVARIWSAADDTEIINVADIDYGQQEVLDHLTIGIGRGEFEGVARADFAGQRSHAASVDAARFAGRAPYATRVCRTVFSHSLVLVATAGAGRNDYLLGTARLGDEPTVIGEALGAVERVAWHLLYDGARWRFLSEPNANKIIAQEMKNVPNSRTNEELEDRIRRSFPSDGQVKSIPFAALPADVPDEPTLRLVVFHHNDVDIDERAAADPPAKALQLLDRVGASERVRLYRNAMVFLVADRIAKDSMRERVRADLAATRLVGDAQRMEGFSSDVRARLRTIADQAKLEARVAVARCFKHLYVPSADRAAGYLRHIELSPRAQGEADKPQTKVIVQALIDESKLRTQALATNYLKSKAWPKKTEHITTAALAEAFWRDHGAPMITDPTLLRDAVREGVRNGSWIYYNPQQQRAWSAADPSPAIELSAETYLYAPEEARRLGLLGRELFPDDIVRAIVEPVVQAAELRVILERVLGREPSKDEVITNIAAAIAGGETASVTAVVGPAEPGAIACTPEQVRAAPIDTLTLLTPQEANKRDIVVGTHCNSKIVEARGVAGVAFQSLQDQVADVDSPGLRTLSITAAADTGEGPRDLALLGQAIGMLPRFDISTELDMELDFKGLAQGAHVRLAGPAADYQRVEDALLGLARTATAVAGSLRLDFHLPEPCQANSGELGRIRKVLTDLQPGELRLKGVLA